MNLQDIIKQLISRAEHLIRDGGAVLPSAKDFQFPSPSRQEQSLMARAYISDFCDHRAAASTMLEVARTAAEANALPAATEALILAHFAASDARAAATLKVLRDLYPVPSTPQVKELTHRAELYVKCVTHRIQEALDAVKHASGADDAQARMEMALQQCEVTLAFAVAAQALAEAGKAEEHLAAKKAELLSTRYTIG